MEQEILQKISEQQIKIDKIYESVEKMRKYFLWTFILSLVFFILPLIAMIFVLPSFINNYLGTLSTF
jgi:TRAP-type mannitol/chloroaromatic compound transport system permease small subunit